jgi:hypothetical protein
MYVMLTNGADDSFGHRLLSAFDPVLPILRPLSSGEVS